MRKSILILGLILLKSLVLSGQIKHQFLVDILHLEEDRVKVTYTPSPSTQAPFIFDFAAIVPGTYSLYNFGRFIQNFRAWDEKGEEISVEKQGLNSWRIRQGGELAKITYEVIDTWDEWGQDNFIFEPAGTGWNEKMAALNWFGVIGFPRGQEDYPFEITVVKPAYAFGASALEAEQISDTLNLFRARDFDHLADSPVLYAEPDTAWIQLGNTRVLIAVQKASGVEISAQNLKSILKRILTASAEYLGGDLPTDRYAFLFRFFRSFSFSGSYGALEHNQSSFYVMPARQLWGLEETVREFAAHEFFHIITPLTLHSEYIHDFNFTEPEISAHLWLYEGVTEYFAQHLMIQGEFVDSMEFLDNLLSIIQAKNRYLDSLPFTELSLGCLDKYADQYNNVYLKGALIGMCLDLEALDQSGGQISLRHLLIEMGKDFGQHKPFPEDSLFEVMEDYGGPWIREFLYKYVGGPHPLPLKDYFLKAGIDFDPGGNIPEYTLGSYEFLPNKKGQIEVSNDLFADEFGELLGLETGDVITHLNDSLLTLENFQQVMADIRNDASPGDTLTLRIIRSGKPMEIQEPMIPVNNWQEPRLEFLPNPTPRQLRVRNAWLGKG